MKILVLAPYSRPFDNTVCEGSGMNPYIKESALELAKKHNVDLYIRRSRRSDKAQKNILKNLKLYTIKAGPTKKLDRDETYLACKKSIFNIKNIDQYDLIISNYWISEAWLSQIMHNVHSKILYISHSFFLNPYRTRYPSKNHIRSEIKISQTCMWCTNSVEEHGAVQGIMPQKKRLFLIHPGADYSNQSQKFNLGSNKKPIVFIGRKTLSKGFNLYCKIAELFPKETFITAGKAELTFKKLDNFHDLGYLDMQKIKYLIKNSKIIICPSTYEHFGLVPLLANYYSIPVIATPRGGFLDVIKNHQNGWFSKPTVNDLQNKLNHFLKIEKKYKYPKDIRHQIISKYNWSKFASRIEQIAQSRELIFKGKIITVKKTPISIKNSIVNYEKIKMKDSVHILPITKDNKFILIKELRPTISNKHILRIISGIVEDDETPDQTASRETLEEIGLKVKKLHKFITIEEENNIESARHYYWAECYNKKYLTQHELREDIQGITYMDIEKLFTNSLNGKFGTSKTVIAINKLYTIFGKKNKGGD